jgi:hypothetical protein
MTARSGGNGSRLPRFEGISQVSRRLLRASVQLNRDRLQRPVIVGVVVLALTAGALGTATAIGGSGNRAGAGVGSGLCTSKMTSSKCAAVTQGAAQIAVQRGLDITPPTSIPPLPSTPWPSLTVVPCGSGFFSESQAADLTSTFGGYTCWSVEGSDQWVVVGSGQNETSPTAAAAPGGEIVAVETCATTDSSCLDANSLHNFDQFTVYYPPDPDTYSLSLVLRASTTLFQFIDPYCGSFLFQSTTGNWYPFSQANAQAIGDGVAMQTVSSPPPLDGASALETSAPPSTGACQ